jgi:hypothetical protein
MKNKLIPALFVLLLTPGLLFAAKPIDETLVKINALDAKLTALAKSVDRLFSTGTYISTRTNPWNQLFPSEFSTLDGACASFCQANWGDQMDSCTQVCPAAATGELSDCSADRESTLTEAHGFIAACKYGFLLPTAPVSECRADRDDPICLAYTSEVMRVLYEIGRRYEHGY